MRKCVLVVEDDPFIRMDVTDIVSLAGYDVVDAQNADEAIVELEKNAAIAIVLTDVEMPGSMDGLKLAYAIRSRWPLITVIVLSGQRHLKNTLPAGAAFVAKPFLPHHIEAALSQAA